MIKKVLALATILFAASAFAQTIQLNTRNAINAGQCVALQGNQVKPCNNFLLPAPAVPIGVALNTVPASAPPPAPPHMLTIQYAGLVTIPDTSYGGYISAGDYLGDVDGTGNLNDLSVPQTGPVYPFLGPTFAGIALGETGTSIIMIVQPGYWPSDCTGNGCPLESAMKQKVYERRQQERRERGRR